MTRRSGRPTPRHLAVCALVLLAAARPLAGEPAAGTARLLFEGSGHTRFGDWSAEGSASSATFAPGAAVRLDVQLRVAAGHLAAMAAAKLPVSSLVLLVTAERTFDADAGSGSRATSGCRRS